MVNFLLLLISVLLAICGQFLMKFGMNQFGSFPIAQLGLKVVPMLTNPFVFAGLAFFGVSSIFWLAILSRINLSLAYPMVSFGYVLVALFSWLIFKEPVSMVRWIGIAVICCGVILISRS